MRTRPVRGASLAIRSSMIVVFSRVDAPSTAVTRSAGAEKTLSYRVSSAGDRDTGLLFVFAHRIAHCLSPGLIRET